MQKRYLFAPVDKHLSELRQMAFITGPRQCGKTTLAKSLIGDLKSGRNYFNWDLPEHRRLLMTELFPGSFKLDQPDLARVGFDEIHKYKRWKNTLKGLFDHYEPKHTHWIITGSAMLNVYRKGQDSLLGRHFTYNLCPFSAGELAGGGTKVVSTIKSLAEMPLVSSPGKKAREYLELLYRLGGFPEPLFNGSESFLKKWRTSRLERLIHQDLASTEDLRNLPMVENLLYLLPDRVGNPLSINSLREDLELHFETVKHWIELLERVYYGFRVRAFAHKISKGIKKEAKFYLWDWTEVQEPGPRFENLMAAHLLKHVLYLNDLGLDDAALFFAKDREQREVDFVLCERRSPKIAIECKLSDEEPSPNLVRFAKQLGIKRCFQVVMNLNQPKVIDLSGVEIHIVSAASFLEQLQ